MEAPTIHYDWDYRLRSGVSIPEGDANAWLAYQARIVEAGVHREGICTEFYLPALDSGLHSLCFVATYKSGASSAEPYCLGLEVP